MSSSGKSKLRKDERNVETMSGNERLALELSAELTSLGKTCAALAIKLINGEMRDEELGDVYRGLLVSLRRTRESLAEVAKKGEKK